MPFSWTAARSIDRSNAGSDFESLKMGPGERIAIYYIGQQASGASDPESKTQVAIN